MDPRRSNANHPAPAGAAPSGGGASALAGNNIVNIVLAVVLIITAVIASIYLLNRLMSNGNNGGAIKGKQYQALFLTNGQVYFGHLSKVDSSYVQMKDIFYLQVQQSVQPTNSGTNSQQVSLAKLGSELHGPEDTMYVSRDQVLFWENLKDSGKVVQAIKNYQSGNK